MGEICKGNRFFKEHFKNNNKKKNNNFKINSVKYILIFVFMFIIIIALFMFLKKRKF